MAKKQKPIDPFTKLSNQRMVEGIGIVFADEIADRVAQKSNKNKKE